MKQKSVMGHSFSEVPNAEIPRSSFDRSSGYKTTFDIGQLIPFFCDEALPGDTFNLKTSGFARLATPIFPIMDNMYLETFYFAVPIRLLWDNWQRMMGEQDAPEDSVDFLVPQLTGPVEGFPAGTMQDYMGIPTLQENAGHSALWQRAYGRIFNDWFRDQNLQDGYDVPTDDGPDLADFSSIITRRGKRHDYFTSALPWPQKDSGQLIPGGITGGGAAVLGIAASDQNWGTANSGWETGGTGTVNYLAAKQSDSTNAFQFEEDPNNPGYPNIRVDPNSLSGGTINQLRQAFQIQKMYERDARGGSRYVEIIRSHFGVTSPDFRLQRSEYLGGGSTPVNISTVHSTTENIDGTAPGEGANLGRLSGIGTASFQGHGFTKSFTEHCILMGFVNVRADLTYQQGMNRMFSRLDRLDYYWPALSHIGEQEILNKELFLTSFPEYDELVFGYQERYAEYRYKPSIVTGLFRSNHPQTLDAWHLCQEFDDPPLLNEEFIFDDPPLDRCIAVPGEPHFIADFYHKLICARPMPLFGVPGNIDRF